MVVKSLFSTVRVLDLIQGMMWMWPWGFGLGMGLMVFLMILFWASIIVGAYFLFSSLFRPRRPYRSGRDEALEIARQRYARGEITREEFEEIKKNLGWGQMRT